MRALGFNISKQQVVALVREIDPSNHGMVSFDTYLEIMTDVASRRDPQEEMKKAFTLFAGEKGLISVQDLKRVCKQLGEKMSEEELGAMVAEFDRWVGGWEWWVGRGGGRGRRESPSICLGCRFCSR
jgi:centrin-3